MGTTWSDLRLDNRPELCQSLGISLDTPNGVLIAAAYEKWGADFATHLLGDFALAVIDYSSGRLILARDPFGIRPLFYVRVGAQLVFASTERALLEVSGIDHVIDRIAITERICGTPYERTNTSYETIKRLPAASVLVFDGQTVEVKRYWEPARDGSEATGSRKELVEQFKDLFAKSVGSRLASVSPDVVPTAALSGGVDSSSIAIQARDLLKGSGKTMPTVSMTLPSHPGANEWKYQKAVIDTGGFQPTVMPCSSIDVEAVYRDFASYAPGVIDLPGSPLSHFKYSAIRENGVAHILDGFGGDEVISHGLYTYSEHAIQGRWGRLMLDVVGSEGWGAPYTMLNFFMMFGPLNRQYWRYAKVRNAIASVFSGPPGEVAKTDFEEKRVRLDIYEAAEIEQKEADRLAGSKRFPTERASHYYNITNPYFESAMESIHRMAGRFSIRCMYPMLDRRLVEFCMDLPASSIQRGGFGRRILRDAMVGSLPHQVLWRRDKCDFSIIIRDSLLGSTDVIEEILANPNDPAFEFFDQAAMADCWRELKVELPRKNPSCAIGAVLRMLSLHFWFQFEADRVAGRATLVPSDIEFVAAEGAEPQTVEG